MIGPPLILALLAALIASQLTTRAWCGQATVLIAVSADRSPLLTGSVAEPSGWLATAVSLARSRQLAGRVVRAARVPGLTEREFLRESSVKLHPRSPVLTFSVSYRRPALAVRLTSAYTGQFVSFFRERVKSPRWASTQSNLVRSRPPAAQAVVFDPAHVTSSFRPHALRNEFLAFVCGALLGLALAVGVGVRTRPTDRDKDGIACEKHWAVGMKRVSLVLLIALAATVAARAPAHQRSVRFSAPLTGFLLRSVEDHHRLFV